MVEKIKYKILNIFQGAPRAIRMDRGTENGWITDFMKAFHDTQTGNKNCVLTGKSPANQRIEGFWATFQCGLGRAWKKHFESVVRRGQFDCQNEQQKYVVHAIKSFYQI